MAARSSLIWSGLVSVLYLLSLTSVSLFLTTSHHTGVLVPCTHWALAIADLLPLLGNNPMGLFLAQLIVGLGLSLPLGLSINSTSSEGSFLIIHA